MTLIPCVPSTVNRCQSGAVLSQNKTKKLYRSLDRQALRAVSNMCPPEWPAAAAGECEVIVCADWLWLYTPPLPQSTSQSAARWLLVFLGVIGKDIARQSCEYTPHSYPRPLLRYSLAACSKEPQKHYQLLALFIRFFGSDKTDPAPFWKKGKKKQFVLICIWQRLPSMLG